MKQSLREDEEGVAQDVAIPVGEAEALILHHAPR